MQLGSGLGVLCGRVSGLWLGRGGGVRDAVLWLRAGCLPHCVQCALASVVSPLIRLRWVCGRGRTGRGGDAPPEAGLCARGNQHEAQEENGSPYPPPHGELATPIHNGLTPGQRAVLVCVAGGRPANTVAVDNGQLGVLRGGTPCAHGSSAGGVARPRSPTSRLDMRRKRHALVRDSHRRSITALVASPEFCLKRGVGGGGGLEPTNPKGCVPKIAQITIKLLPQVTSQRAPMDPRIPPTQPWCCRLAHLLTMRRGLGRGGERELAGACPERHKLPSVRLRNPGPRVPGDAGLFSNTPGVPSSAGTDRRPAQPSPSP